ncbi:MAG TPA: hypothetical protein VF179_24410 [Thermoanaerobaculia bacterium]|nr:hypothetical protein [Thermoanaerobaculia bacterium]
MAAETVDNSVSPEIQKLIRRAVLAQQRQMIAFVVVMASIIIAVFTYLIPRSSRSALEASLAEELQVRAYQVEKQMNELHSAQAELSKSRTRLQQSLEELSRQALRTEGLPAAAVATELASARQGVDELRETVGRLDLVYDALQVDTAKALAIPMIRRDLDQLRQDIQRTDNRVTASLSEVRKDFGEDTSRIYDLGKWFLGVVLGASLIPLLEPVFRRRREESSEPKDKTKEKPAKEAA